MNLAAIDIGSNAARLLVMEVKRQPGGQLVFNKLKLLRYPIRLGFDVFTRGEISSAKASKLVKMLEAFKLFMELYDVEDYLAFATSAMRDSTNGSSILKKVKEEINMDIEVIDGPKEASILFETHFAEAIRPERNYVYVDVGGGSTEITFYLKRKLAGSHSFKIGTIRLLNNLVGAAELEEMASWVRANKLKGESHFGIGSGGNINSVFSMAGHRKNAAIPLKSLKKWYKEMAKLTIEERMEEYSFKLDRADVVVPALLIYKTVFEAAGVKEIYVPKIGLSDGMVKLLSKKYFE